MVQSPPHKIMGQNGHRQMSNRDPDPSTRGPVRPSSPTGNHSVRLGLCRRATPSPLPSDPPFDASTDLRPPAMSPFPPPPAQQDTPALSPDAPMAPPSLDRPPPRPSSGTLPNLSPRATTQEIVQAACQAAKSASPDAGSPKWHDAFHSTLERGIESLIEDVSASTTRGAREESHRPNRLRPPPQIFAVAHVIPAPPSRDATRLIPTPSLPPRPPPPPQTAPSDRPQPSAVLQDPVELAPDIEGELSDHLPQIIYRASFRPEGSLDFEMPVREANEMDADFDERVSDERNRLSKELSRRAPLIIERDGRQQDWTMEEILILLNSLPDDWTCPRGCRVNEDGGGSYACTFCPRQRAVKEDKIPDPCLHIRYPIPIQGAVTPDGAGRKRRTQPLTLRPRIEISVSVAWIVTAQARPSDAAPREPIEAAHEHVWSQIQARDEESFLDAKGRTRLKSRPILTGHSEGHFPLRHSSSWIWRNELLLLHQEADFSPAVRNFVRHFPNQWIQGHNFVVARLYDALHMTRGRERVDHSADTFLNLPGWLCLRLCETKRYDGRERYTHEGNERSIMSGFWVQTQAPSILTDNEIDGLIMDTTFKVLRLYHTAILVAVSHNVGIPIALSFGPAENIALYDSFYTAFDALGINLRGWILESDQGWALKAVGRRHPRHLFCLHHVLRALDKKCGRFASLVGNLLRTPSKRELDVLIGNYTPDFANVTGGGNPHESEQLNRCLKKVGLRFSEDRLIYADSDGKRWSQVAMIGRLGTRMPTTSNTIESLNGRLNEDTPRHNTFWGSLHRLAEMFTRKIGRFEECCRHNMRYEIGKARRRFRNVTGQRMTREMAFFETQATTCLCGETVLGSMMYRLDIVCSHRIAHWHRDSREDLRRREGGPIPPDNRPMPSRIFALIAVRSWPDCRITVEDFQSASLDPGNEEHLFEVERLVRRIAKDAHVTVANRGGEIRAFVEANYWESNEFALGESMGFLDVHRRGVIHISRAVART